MPIDKTKYCEMIDNDVIAVSCIFNEMNLKEKMTAVLFLLDTGDSSNRNFKNFLLSEYSIHLRCIKEANKKISGNDDLLIEEAVRLYYEKTNTQPEPLVESEPEEIKNFYFLLTKE